MVKDEDIQPMLTDEYAMLAMLYLSKGDRKTAEKYGEMAWRLLENLGFLGEGEKKEGFGLERLLEGIGGLGGDGRESGRGWRRGRG